MGHIRVEFRLLSIMLVFATAAPAARAAHVPPLVLAFPDNRNGFAIRTAATSIGNLPTDGPVSSATVGGVTFVTDSGSLFFGDFSTRVPNHEMIISGQEDFHFTLPAGVYSVGFDIFEPTFGGSSGCNGPCVDDQFKISFYSGATLLGSYDYNAPDDDGTAVTTPIGFIGLLSELPITRVTVDDVLGNIDNEMFANFLTGTLVYPSPTLHGSWGRLKSTYR